VHQPVDRAVGACPDRLQEQGHGRRRDDGRERAPVPVGDGGTGDGRDRQVQRGDETGEDGQPQRPGHDPVDLVQPVAQRDHQDRDRDPEQADQEQHVGGR
jgi:hypothetical protein